MGAQQEVVGEAGLHGEGDGVGVYEGDSLDSLLADAVDMEGVVEFHTGGTLKGGDDMEVVDDRRHALAVLEDALGDGVEVFVLKAVAVCLQHLCEAADDVQRGAYLVGELLDELRLLMV